MLTYYQFTDGALERCNDVRRTIWTRCENPSADDLFHLHQLGLDDDLVNDALDPHEIPRIEQGDGWVYFITRLPGVDDNFNDFTTPMAAVC